MLAADGLDAETAGGHSRSSEVAVDLRDDVVAYGVHAEILSEGPMEPQDGELEIVDNGE